MIVKVLRVGALYQGTTLVGPFHLEKSWALAPVLLCLISTWPLGFAAVFAVLQGLKPRSFSTLYGPTKVVP